MILIFCSVWQRVKTQVKLWLHNLGAILSLVLRPVESTWKSAERLHNAVYAPSLQSTSVHAAGQGLLISWWQYSTRVKTSQTLNNKKGLFHLPVSLVVILTWGNSRWDCGKEMNLMREMGLPGPREWIHQTAWSGLQLCLEGNHCPIMEWSMFTIEGIFTKFNSKGLASPSSVLVNQDFNLFFSTVVHMKFMNWASLRKMWRKCSHKHSLAFCMQNFKYVLYNKEIPSSRKKILKFNTNGMYFLISWITSIDIFPSFLCSFSHHEWGEKKEGKSQPGVSTFEPRNFFSVSWCLATF